MARAAKSRPAVKRWRSSSTKTPFYAESGGQVGDRGTLRVSGGVVEVADAQRPARWNSSCTAAWSPRAKCASTPTLNSWWTPTRARRPFAITSGTHLLHAALRGVLGNQAMQKGSLVGPNRLRFDFTHDLRHSTDRRDRARSRTWRMAGSKRNAPANVRFRSCPTPEAVESGAVAIFEEKYGDEVRVVSSSATSRRSSAAGQHAGATGDIGVLKIVSESGIAARGVRRIEALTGLERASNHMRAQERALAQNAARTAASIDRSTKCRRVWRKLLAKSAARRRTRDRPAPIGVAARQAAPGTSLGDASVPSKA